METEAILVNAVRIGKRPGLACPDPEFVYALMKLRELQLNVVGRKYSQPNN